MQHALPTHAPDLTTLIGASRKLARGQLAPAAVPFHNAAHRVWGPLALLAAGTVRRGLGFGLRTPAGFQRG